MTKKEKLELLMADTTKERLGNLKVLLEQETEPPKKRPEFANNHIHTTYSFSPYSPTAAVYFAREAGLETAGIMDHDSIGGANEFRQAGEIAGVGTTCGIECRISMKDTSLASKRFNNPDQKGIAYMLIHSVMPGKYDFVQETFAPLRERRNLRNKKMIDKINQLFGTTGIAIDFEADVVPVSWYNQGGTITERHILWALSGKILDNYQVSAIPEVLERLGVSLKEAERGKFTEDNQDIQYDLLGIFKAYFVEQFYIPATDECLTLQEAITLAKEAEGILCYSYLGDVEESVTGDKRQEQYEDEFLDELFEMVYEEGVRAITYSPSRNTKAQIARVQALCRQYGMLEISGEDINTPGQSFICEKLKDPEFKHLVDETWNLIEREKS
jgi:hypothetical protein